MKNSVEEWAAKKKEHHERRKEEALKRNPIFTRGANKEESMTFFTLSKKDKFGFNILQEENE